MHHTLLLKNIQRKISKILDPISIHKYYLAGSHQGGILTTSSQHPLYASCMQEQPEVRKLDHALEGHLKILIGYFYYILKT